MLRKSLSSILTLALTSMMFFSMSVEVFATNEEIPVEDIGKHWMTISRKSRQGSLQMEIH